MGLKLLFLNSGKHPYPDFSRIKYPVCKRLFSLTCKKFSFSILNVYCITHHFFQISFNYFVNITVLHSHVPVTYVLCMVLISIFVVCSCLNTFECAVNQKIKLILLFLSFVLL